MHARISAWPQITHLLSNRLRESDSTINPLITLFCLSVSKAERKGVLNESVHLVGREVTFQIGAWQGGWG